MKSNKQILILGGGFAGLEAAIQLRKKALEVILVSDRDFLFIYPTSIWVPVRKTSLSQVKISLSKLASIHGFKLIIDKVIDIQGHRNTVFLEKEDLKYDFLVLAMGMSKLKMKGLEHTHSICGNPAEAEVIKEELDQLIQQGKGSIAIGFGGNPKDPTATSVRGGPAFELLFNISHYLKKLKLRDQFDIHFFAPMSEPGKKMGDKPYKKLDQFFKRYEIKVHKGKKITHFDHKEIYFEDDTKLNSDLIIFIPGGAGHELLTSSDLPLSEAGFVKIDDECGVESFENIYAIGDVAALQGPKWAAKQGHIAEVMAKVAANNIYGQINGHIKRLSYREHLNIICIMDSGDGAAFVMRTDKKEMMIPMPIIGHWLKRFWGFYYKNSKLKRFPRIPGM